MLTQKTDNVETSCTLGVIFHYKDSVTQQKRQGLWQPSFSALPIARLPSHPAPSQHSGSPWDPLTKMVMVSTWTTNILKINSEDLMYNMVAIVDKTILYNWNLLKVELFLPKKKKWLIYEVINMLINSIVGILSQCIQILSTLYTSSIL